MVVYVEIVFIDNFIIDYMLMKASVLTLGLPFDKTRLFLCSFLGALFSILYTLLPLNGILQIVCKILFGMIMVLTVCKEITFKKVYLLFLIFLTYTFLLGGAIIGVFSLLNMEYNSETSISLMIIPCYLILKLCKNIISFFNKKSAVTAFLCDVELSFKKINVRAKGFLDSGNCVYNGDSPVIFCSRRICNKFLIENKVFSSLKRIPINTINGKSTKLCFLLDSVKVYYNGIESIFNNVTIAVTNAGFGYNYDVILNSSFIGELKNEDLCNTKKVG